MKNQQIYQQKAFLYALACLSALLVCARCDDKPNTKKTAKQMKPATVINHHTYIGGDYYPMMQFLLDTDGDKKTAESVCEISLENIHPLTTNDLKQILPIGATRTMWEWNKIGRISKFEQR